MRTFSLFALMLLVSALSTVQASPLAASKVLKSADFFTVVFPYDEALTEITSPNGEAERKTRQGILNTAIKHAMTILLVRVTGQKSFLISEAGQEILSNPRALLRTYDITPRVEEGVQVGQNIVLRFSEHKLRAALKARDVAIWPISARSTTLVMGSLVRKGQLLKLNQENMRYRLDIEFRDDALQMMLPISLPKSTQNWIFPVDPMRMLNRIQEVLVASDHDYLLSFKLLAKGGAKNRLVWNVYSDSGAVISHGEFEGENIQMLIQGMFEQVMAAYVEIDSQQALTINQFVLNVHNLFDATQIQALEKLLKSQMPMIRSSQLVSVQAGRAQFNVVYQGERKKLLKWIRSWQIANLMQMPATSNQIDVMINISYFAKESESTLLPKAEQAIEATQTTQGVQ
ncbi:MAG: hypothetical protein ISEC1_P1155 [Thiomicrorhabdus sp.]|nr:MAG: hypothetical protein ISEC1_P1155 [Thiomicrorhabdus sp.]